MTYPNLKTAEPTLSERTPKGDEIEEIKYETEKHEYDKKLEKSQK